MGGRGRRTFGGAFGGGGAFEGFGGQGFGIGNDDVDTGLGRIARLPISEYRGATQRREDARLARQATRQARASGGGAGSATTTQSVTNSASTAQTASRQAVQTGASSKFTASLEKEYGIGAKGRDAISSANWNGNFTATFEDSNVPEKLKKLFGKDLSARDIGLLVGAPDGARVRIESSRYSDEVKITTTHPFFNGLIRTISKDYQGKLKVHNDYFAKNKQNAPAGLGGRQLAIQSAVARKLGVSYIDTSAARDSSSFNGYYTWARTGFNASIAGYSKPAHLAKAKDLNSVFKFDAKQRLLGHKIDKATGRFTSGKYKGQQSGSDWWSKNGGWTEMVFDLNPSSTSSKVLAYWQKENKVFGANTQYTRGRTTRTPNAKTTRTRKPRKTT